MDKIFLDGIRFEIRVGTIDEERSQSQLCGLDLSLETDLKSAGKSGHLTKTVDYASVFRRIESLCTQKSFCLLEEIGHQICEEVLTHYPVEKIKLKLRKVHPFSTKLNSVGIELKRYRKSMKQHP